jgi:hypothetical protein
MAKLCDYFQCSLGDICSRPCANRDGTAESDFREIFAGPRPWT